MTGHREVTLRREEGEDFRSLTAHLGADGSLCLAGHDMGPSTAIVSPDGEYEWRVTIATEHLPRLVELLGGDPDSEILDLLERSYAGERSYEFERRLRDSGLPSELWTWR